MELHLTPRELFCLKVRKDRVWGLLPTGGRKKEVHLWAIAVNLGNLEVVPYPLQDSFQSDTYEAPGVSRT